MKDNSAFALGLRNERGSNLSGEVIDARSGRGVCIIFRGRFGWGFGCTLDGRNINCTLIQRNQCFNGEQRWRFNCNIYSHSMYLLEF